LAGGIRGAVKKKRPGELLVGGTEIHGEQKTKIVGENKSNAAKEEPSLTTGTLTLSDEKKRKQGIKKKKKKKKKMAKQGLNYGISQKPNCQRRQGRSLRKKGRGVRGRKRSSFLSEKPKEGSRSRGALGERMLRLREKSATKDWVLAKGSGAVGGKIELRGEKGMQRKKCLETGERKRHVAKKARRGTNPFGALIDK